MRMEMESQHVDKASVFTRGWLQVMGHRAKIEVIARQTTQIARDDPRILIHSIKVGLAITAVSLFYYFQPLYSSFGVSAVWAVVTVVVIFEFYSGATLGKGVNRGLATLTAGGLGLGAHYLACLTGSTGEPILTVLFDFVLAVALTYLRFFPKIKARFDYGMMIFILTFCLVSISGLQTDDVVKLAQKRLWTILLGALACVAVSVCIYPVWAGEDLHRLVARNLKQLGSFLEGFAEECLRMSSSSSSEGRDNGRSSLVCVLVDSRNDQETLANLARWEPGHGRFMCRHPWEQYLKIGKLTRQCACRVKSLNTHLNTKAKAPQEIQEAFSVMSSELGKTLKALARNIETMTTTGLSPLPNPYIEHLKVEAKNLKSLLRRELRDEQDSSLLQVIIPVAATASLLIETVDAVEAIAEAVSELSLLAKFKRVGIAGMNDNDDEDDDHHNNNNNNNHGKGNLEEVGMMDNPSVGIRID